ncbi:MAG TPA: hypothetical protein VFL80_13155 [Thermoanaerobaculia bacterium]|nr:hypothetical protein [Thermoanaerobaculia bacterium]
MSEVSALYPALAERDRPTVEQSVRAFRTAHGDDELFVAVARFAVLAYAPAQHAKHALMACLAAHDVRTRVGERFGDLLLECAWYAASSRQPWSEPPILDPPPTRDDEASDLGALRKAIADGDRLAGERWLAARIADPGLARDLFAAACDDFEDLGHKLIVAVHAWRLAELLGEKGRYAALRTAVWEMTAYRGALHSEEAEADTEQLLSRIIDVIVSEEGSIIAAHRLFLLDAAMEAVRIAEDPGILRRVSAHLVSNLTEDGAPIARHQGGDDAISVYVLGRDCAEFLKMHAAAARLGARFPGVDVTRAVAAASYNLQNAPSLEDWSFA